MHIDEEQLFATWVIDTTSKTPLYKQLANYLKAKIDNKEVNSKYVFPAFRVLENLFDVSRFTLSSCFDLLVAEGYVKQNKSRQFEVCVDEIVMDEKNIKWQHFIERSSHAINKPNVLRNSDVIKAKKLDGKLYFINCDEFETREIYVESIKKAADNLSLAMNWQVQSEPELLEHLIHYLKKRDIHVNPSQILVTQNEHSSIYLMITGFLSSTSTVITTKPNRFAQLTALETSKTNTVIAKTDNNGIILDDLYAKIKTAYNPVLYIEPNYSYPSGISMSEQRKHEIVDMCIRMNVPIIESDYQRDYATNYRPPMKSFNSGANIVYQSSLGTMISYNSSMGFIVGSEYIIDHLSNIYANIAPRCTNMVQALYIELLKSGTYENLLENLRPKLQKRINDANQLFSHYLSQYATWQMPDGGVFFMIKFNKNIHYIKMDMLVTKCNWEYYHENKNMLQIAVASCTLDELELFIKHLAKECKKQSSALHFATD